MGESGIRRQRSVCEHEGICFLISTHMDENPWTATTHRMQFLGSETSDESVKPFEKPQYCHDLSPTMQDGIMQMLHCLEMQRCVTGFTTAGLLCYHRMDIRELQRENNSSLTVCVCVTAVEGPVLCINNSSDASPN